MVSHSCFTVQKAEDFPCINPSGDGTPSGGSSREDPRWRMLGTNRCPCPHCCESSVPRHGRRRPPPSAGFCFLCPLALRLTWELSAACCCKGLVCSGARWALWPDTHRDQAAAGAAQASHQLPGRIHGNGASHWSDSVRNRMAPLTVCVSLCPLQEQAASTRTGCSVAGQPHWGQAVLGDTGWYGAHSFLNCFRASGPLCWRKASEKWRLRYRSIFSPSSRDPS